MRLSDAKLWLIKLQQKEGKSYSTIHSIRGVLRPAFQLAVDDDLIRKNPFQFKLASVIVNASVTREAITQKQQREFLNFVLGDKHYSKYYDVFYILFHTDLRISEFCGLPCRTLSLIKTGSRWIISCCSNMVKSGINPKTLQYIMDHSDISVTLNTYTHFQFDDAREELLRVVGK